MLRTVTIERQRRVSNVGRAAETSTAAASCTPGAATR